MTAIPVICTGDITPEVRFPPLASSSLSCYHPEAHTPIQLWQDFVTSSQRPVTSPRINIFTLVRSPTDGIRSPSTDPPIEPFETGFKDASPSTLESFFESTVDRIRAIGKPQDVARKLSPFTFVVLDKTSLNDRTAVVSNKVEEYDKDIVHHPEPTKIEWRQTRVKFEAAWYLVAALEEKPHTIYLKEEVEKGWGKGDKFDENGVYIADIKLDD